MTEGREKRAQQGSNSINIQHNRTKLIPISHLLVNKVPKVSSIDDSLKRDTQDVSDIDRLPKSLEKNAKLFEIYRSPKITYGMSPLKKTSFFDAKESVTKSDGEYKVPNAYKRVQEHLQKEAEHNR